MCELNRLSLRHEFFNTYMYWIGAWGPLEMNVDGKKINNNRFLNYGFPRFFCYHLIGIQFTSPFYRCSTCVGDIWEFRLKSKKDKQTKNACNSGWARRNVCTGNGRLQIYFVVIFHACTNCAESNRCTHRHTCYENDASKRKVIKWKLNIFFPFY